MVMIAKEKFQTPTYAHSNVVGSQYATNGNDGAGLASVAPHDAKYFYEDCMKTAAMENYRGKGMQYWIPICMEETNFKYDPSKS